MTINVSEVFRAQSQSLGELLNTPGQCFYIPAYQRPYSWSDPKIAYIFENICVGAKRLLASDSSVAFLGTIITLHDTAYTTILPMLHGQVPTRVMTVIDGQQRLTTVMLILTVLHEQSVVAIKKLENKQGESVEWLKAQLYNIEPSLKAMFCCDMNHGQSRYYPKIIRAFIDQWSRNTSEAKYFSPIGWILNSYIGHINSENSTRENSFNRSLQGAIPIHPEIPVETYEFTVKRRDYIFKKLVKPSMSSTDDNSDQPLEFPAVNEILESAIFQKTLFLNTEIPSIVKEQILDSSEQKEMLKLICLIQFVIQRVAFTNVTVTREDYAFDVFEALNTSGEPLTAFETFKPKVVEFAGLSHYRESPHYLNMVSIEKYLGDDVEKADKTSELLISFASLFSGTKLSKKLSEQRSYMKEEFDRSGELKRLFIEGLKDTSTFYSNMWHSDKVWELPTTDGQFSARFLRDSNHSVVIPFLCASKSVSIQELDKNIKFCTAFFILLRTKFLGTAGIDKLYRDLFSQDSSALSLKNGGSTLEKLINARRTLMSELREKGFGEYNLETWKLLLRSNPLYREKSIVKFLMAIYMTKGVASDDRSLVMTSGRTQLNNFMDYNFFDSAIFKEIEHIAPVNSSNWEADIYTDTNTVNKIGNLTILPKIENIVASNHSWENKKALYQLFASRTVEEANVARAIVEGYGLRSTPTIDRIVENSTQLSYLRPLINHLTWDQSAIQTRCDNIAEMTWPTLWQWLNVD
jgi:hypothetical protein